MSVSRRESRVKKASEAFPEESSVAATVNCMVVLLFDGAVVAADVSVVVTFGSLGKGCGSTIVLVVTTEGRAVCVCRSELLGGGMCLGEEGVTRLAPINLLVSFCLISKHFVV